MSSILVLVHDASRGEEPEIEFFQKTHNPRRHIATIVCISENLLQLSRTFNEMQSDKKVATVVTHPLVDKVVYTYVWHMHGPYCPMKYVQRYQQQSQLHHVSPKSVQLSRKQKH